jgi:hypothetical protein
MSEWDLEKNGVKVWHLMSIKNNLSFNVGKENAISRRKLLKKTTGLTDRQLRLAIYQLRNDGVLICSRGGFGGGYWMAKDLDDLLTFIERELKSRAYDMLRTAKRLESAGIHKFGQQLGQMFGDET